MKLKILVLVSLLMLCALPTLAQDSINTVTFNGFSFSYDSTVAANVAISQFPGDAPAPGPGAAEPPYTQFVLFNEFPVPESILDAVGGVRVYNTADFAGFSEHEGRLAELQSLLDTRVDLADFMNADGVLPFIPVFPAGQVLRAQAQYLETAAVRGIRYVTAYQEAAEPFLRDSFLYTFQGISADGTRYISVIFGLTTGIFPPELPSDFDPEAFSAGLDDYITESTAQLNAAADFTPPLTTLDTLVQSISFAETSVTPTSAAPAATATVETTDPTMGGLAGVNWTLVSYGSADAPTPVLTEAPITATFSEQGVTGSAGCNTYNGPFQFANGTISFGELVSTEIGCADAVNAQETAFLTALATANTFQLADGQLQITYDGGVLTFRDSSLVATALEGNWTLVSYGSADAPTPVLAEAPITATFAANQVSGSAGCNQYSGTVQVEGNTVTFGELVSTLIACEEPIQTQETTYLEALRTATAFQLTDGQLQITYAGGVLTFTPA